MYVLVFVVVGSFLDRFKLRLVGAAADLDEDDDDAGSFVCARVAYLLTEPALCGTLL